MNTSGPIWKALSGIMVMGIVLSPMGIKSNQYATASPPSMGQALLISSANADPVDSGECATKPVRITLASEQISFCSPTDLPFSAVEDSLSEPYVNYGGLTQLNGYGVINVRAVSAGYAPGPGQPVYTGSTAAAYRQVILQNESAQPGRTVSIGPSAEFWGEKISSIQVDLVISTSTGKYPLRVVEWFVLHNSRLWNFIIAWDTTMENAQSWEKASENFSIQNPSSQKLPDTALDLGKGPQPSESTPGEIRAAGGPVDVERPSWWDGDECNSTNHFNHTSPHTISSLLSSWHGVSACGPGSPSYGVYFFTGDYVGALEFQCVELVLRFFYLQWQIRPWSGNGNSLKDHYDTSKIDFYENDGTHPIIPGDAITENGDGTHPNSVGHTLLVTDVSGLDGTGSGKIWILEQNSIPSGIRQLNVHNWIVDPDTWTWSKTIQGWLHAKANQPSGDVDSTFSLAGDGLNGPVTALGIQSPDNKIIAGGDFTAYATEPRNHIVQINSNGSLDTDFAPIDGVSGTGTPQVFALNVLSDHKILLGGYFDKYDNIAQTNLARLNSDGTLESAFNNGAGGATFTDDSPASVNAFAIQPSDSNILVGGNFNRYNGGNHQYIARVSGTDGAVDSSFHAGTDGPIYAIVSLLGDKTLIGGNFLHGILRLGTNGTLDTLFNPSPASGANGAVRSIALQEDKIYIAGNFSTYNGVSRNGIARLNSDGSLDTTFNPGTGIGGTLPYLTTVLPQPDGRILIGGSFSTYNGSGILNFARLNHNGSLDSTFLSRKSSDGIVNAILLQQDGKILIGGAFSGYLTRLLNEIEPCYILTALVNPSAPVAGGNVSANPPPNCPGGKYISGTPVQLTAARNSAGDFWFTHWSGEASGITNTVSVIMDDDKTVMANFMASPGGFIKSSPDNGAIDIPADVNLSWAVSSGASSYEYCLYTTSNSVCNSNSSWVSTGGNTTVSLTNLFPTTTYHWQVRARNQVDTTDASDGWRSFTRSGVPQVPVTISPNGIIFTNIQPTYTWNVSNGATSYRLVVYSTGPETPFSETIVPGSACSGGICRFHPAEPLPVASYEFKISAIAGSESEFSPWRPFSMVEAVGILYLPLMSK